MRSLTQLVLTGTSCAVLLLHSTVADSASGTRTAAATTAGTFAANLSGDDNRANVNRRLVVESSPRYVESIRDDETTDLPISAPADLHGPAGGLSNLRGGQQQSQQHMTNKTASLRANKSLCWSFTISLNDRIRFLSSPLARVEAVVSADPKAPKAPKAPVSVAVQGRDQRARAAIAAKARAVPNRRGSHR